MIEVNVKIQDSNIIVNNKTISHDKDDIYDIQDDDGNWLAYSYGLEKAITYCLEN